MAIPALIILISNSLAGPSIAQTGTLSGVVQTREGKPLPNTNVIVVGTYFGSTTNTRGEFKISRIPSGTYDVEMSFLGYGTVRVKGIRVLPGVNRYIEITMEEEPIHIDRVLVVGEVTPIKRIEVSQVRFEGRMVREMPGAVEDVMRTVQTMPGVTFSSDFNAQAYVRGDAPDRNLVLLDGVEVLFPYRFFGLLSMFNPVAVDNLELLAGGFPAEYGDYLASVLKINTREGNREKICGDIDISITNTNGILEGPIFPQWGGSFMLSGRRTYYDLIANLFLPEGGVLPNFYDLQGKLVLNPMSRSKLTFNNFYSNEGMKFEAEGSNNGYRWTKNVHSLGWNYIASPSSFFRTLVAYSSNFVNFWEERRKAYDEEEGRSDFKLNFNTMTVKEDFAYRINPAHGISGGGGVRLSQYRIWFENSFDFEILKTRATSPWIYLQDEWRVTDGFSLQGGLRGDYSSLTGDVDLSPRVHLSIKMTPITTLHAAWGIYYQSPSEKCMGENLLMQMFFGNCPNRIFDWKKYGKQVDSERSDHYILGFEHHLGFKGSDWKLTWEFYKKKNRDLIYPITYPVPESDLESRSDDDFIPSQNFSGTRQGFDIILNKENFEGEERLGCLLNYSYGVSQDTKVQTGETFYTGYDRTHSFKLTGNYTFSPKFRIGINFRLVSGVPYTPGYVAKDEYGDYRMLYKAYNSGRLPLYHRLDIRFNFKPHWFGLKDVEAYFEFINVYNHKNVMFYGQYLDFGEYPNRLDPPVYVEDPIGMLPIFPTFGIKVNF